MTAGPWTAAALVLTGIGVADAAARSWRLLLRPTATRALGTGLLRQAAASATGAALWAVGCSAVWTGGAPGPGAAGAVLALWPLLLAVLARMPVAGRPLLLAVHALAVAEMAAAAPGHVPGPVAWGAALLGYGVFAVSRSVLAPSAPAASVPLHLAPRILSGRSA